MHNGRFRLMASLAGATLCVFAVSANSQTPTTTPAPTSTTGTATPYAQGTGSPSTPTTGTTDPNAAVTAPQTAAPTTTGTTVTGTTATDATTTTTTSRGFPGGFWGIIAVAVIVLLILFSLFRGKDRTVVRDTYTSSTTTVPVNRNVGTGTAVGDRSLNPRTASGTGTSNNPGGTNDPNTRL